jgi:hypothetical protein
VNPKRIIVVALVALGSVVGLASSVATQDAKAVVSYWGGNWPGNTAKWNPDSGYSGNSAVGSGSPWYWQAGTKYCDDGSFQSTATTYTAWVNLVTNASRQNNPWGRNNNSTTFPGTAYSDSVSRPPCGP